MNPILSREIRGRFRDKRSFWLLFGVSALLCIAASLLYASATSFNNYYVGGAEAENQSGRELFRFLALGNALAWLLIAPALTATGLAIERERGLLESLWLSPFRVRSQIWGRLGAALCFLLVLQVATLPIYGIAVLLGGVSLFDIGISGLIIALGALTATSFGLFCSARSYRGSSALGAAFLGVVGWSVAATYSAYQLLWGVTPESFTVAFSHPIVMLWLLLSPTDFSRPFGVPITVPLSDALRWGPSFQLVASLFLLWGATRKASKPLPDMQ